MPYIMGGSTNGNANISQVAVCRMCDRPPRPRRRLGASGPAPRSATFRIRGAAGRVEREARQFVTGWSRHPPARTHHMSTKTARRLIRIDADEDRCWLRGQRPFDDP
jgi:hypothetical protein